MTTAQLHALLSHPDAHVRSLADNTLRALRPLPAGNRIHAYRFEDRLTARLAALARNGLHASPAYYLP